MHICIHIHMHMHIHMHSLVHPVRGLWVPRSARVVFCQGSCHIMFVQEPKQVIAHVDMDAFYTQVEVERFFPSQRPQREHSCTRGALGEHWGSTVVMTATRVTASS